jgi:preprotein translocase subunit SecG
MLLTSFGCNGSKPKRWWAFLFFRRGTQQVGGVQKTSDFLDRSTWILATLLLTLILISNATLSSNDESLDSKLIEDGSIEQSIPETTEQTFDEIPEIPEVPQKDK